MLIWDDEIRRNKITAWSPFSAAKCLAHKKICTINFENGRYGRCFKPCAYAVRCDWRNKKRDNVANLNVKEQPFDQLESSFQDENDNDTDLQEPEIDLRKTYSTCCNEKDPLEDATTTTEFPNELPLWPEGQVLVNGNSNHNVSSISIKEETCDQAENIGDDPGKVHIL